jgi:Holliday junction resolvase
VKPERKLWYELKKNSTSISWTRLENSAAFGTPDLLGYNPAGNFFTVELKVTRGNKISFSPHQIAFHVKHPDKTFIMVKALSLNLVKLYEGKVIKELDACGLKLEPYCEGLEACIRKLESA